MTISELPLLVLLHGAWHQSSSFDKLQPLLEQQGFEVISPAFISSSKAKENPQATHLDDIAAISQILLPHFDQGREAVLVGHSYGAIPAVGIAQEQCIVVSAAHGKKGGVRAIVFSQPSSPSRSEFASNLRTGFYDHRGKHAIFPLEI